MNAKDTVIKSASECDAIPFRWLNPEDIYYIKQVCGVQAEIFFKAGIIQGKKEQYIVDWEHEGEAVKLAKQAGIKEVVEWIRHNATQPIAVKDSDNSQEMDIRAIPEELWQAKLKEWGIKYGD